jgi:hypothetical protein
MKRKLTVGTNRALVSGLRWLGVKHDGHTYEAAPCSMAGPAIAIRRDGPRSKDAWVSDAASCIEHLVAWRLPRKDAEELVREANGRREK